MTQQSWVYIQKTKNTKLRRYMHLNVCNIIIYNCQGMETT